MNFLGLTNTLISKCGISGGGISTVSGQSGEPLRAVNWVNEAWLNIQLASTTWNWMRNSLMFTTTSGKYAYSPAECGVLDLGSWKMDSFRRYITATGVRSENFLTEMDFDSWRDTYLFGNMRLSPGDPLFVATGPDLSLNFGLIPGDVGYTIVGEYYRAPDVMTTDADMPHMPAQYHMAIVYRAMIMYGMYESASEVVQEGQSLFKTMNRRLMRDQMDDLSLGGALA